jgi:hypothetical protein
MAKAKDRSGGNEEAVRIILPDPKRYAGLPLRVGAVVDGTPCELRKRTAAGGEKPGGRPQGRVRAGLARPKWSTFTRPSGVAKNKKKNVLFFIAWPAWEMCF